MRDVMKKTLTALGAAACAVTLIAGATGTAEARDDWRDRRWHRDHDRRDHDRWDRRHHHHYHDRGPRVVERRVIERPVYMQPAPVFAAPMYQQPQDPSVNFNFTIPLR
jgi:Ni/Co efflux regulator RcnB